MASRAIRWTGSWLGISFVGALACTTACGGGEVDGDNAGGATVASSTHAGSTTTTSQSATGSTTHATAASTTSGTGGGGGEAGWPTCDSQPTGSTIATIPEIWTADPATPIDEWVPGVYVTGVSQNGCQPNVGCQIFVQQDETYADFADAQQKSLRIDVFPTVASHFVGIAVGDKVDLYASAARNTLNMNNELRFFVSESNPGCFKKVGSGTPVPVSASLDDLSVDAYESQGPVLITVDLVSGKPHLPAETFALWATGSQQGGDITTVTSLSPFFLANEQFTGLTAETITDFDSVTGVFGIFFPSGTIKYEEIYPRTDAEYPVITN